METCNLEKCNQDKDFIIMMLVIICVQWLTNKIKPGDVAPFFIQFLSKKHNLKDAYATLNTECKLPMQL